MKLLQQFQPLVDGKYYICYETFDDFITKEVFIGYYDKFETRLKGHCIRHKSDTQNYWAIYSSNPILPNNSTFINTQLIFELDADDILIHIVSGVL